MKKAIPYLCAIVLFIFSGCKKFLDVQLSDRIISSKLYETTEGFKTALNGVYIGMASDQLYGRQMSAGVIDIMAQYYFVATNWQTFRTYGYTDVTVNKPFYDQTWRKYYELIVNTNTIIKESKETDVLSANNKNIILGEALALRAFLHFDVFRLCGPIYSEGTQDQITIPYSTSDKPVVSDFRSASAIMDSVINDLTAAIRYLEVSDPVISEGRKNSSDLINGDFLSYRQFRFNYFAVKALLARVYLWKNDPVNARKYALEVIQQAKAFFPFVTSESALNANNPDRIFSTEVLFAAYDNTRTGMFNAILAPNASGNDRIYIQGDASGRVNEMYDDKADYRFLAYTSQQVGNISVYYNRKYESINVFQNNQTVGSEFNYYIPLIRMSEMYYIAAECAGTVAEGLGYLNQVRLARSARDLAAADMTALNLALRNEYRREFISEGQLFYYYKRRSLTSIPNGSTASSNFSMPLINYVVPMVDSEVNLRN